MSVASLIGAQRAAILARDDQTAARIDAAHTQLRAWLAPRVDRLTAQLQAARDAGEPVNLSWLLREHRLSGLLESVRAHVAEFGTQAQAMVEQLQRDAAQAGARDAGALLDAALRNDALRAGISLTFDRVPQEALDKLIGRVAYNGQPLRDLFKGFGEEAMSKVRAILYSAVGLGENPKQVAAQLARALNISRNRALTIARTEMMGAYRDATLARFSANADVCNGWQWQASAGACPFCADMDGTQHTLDEDMDTHARCRCTMLPLTRSYDDILAALDTDVA